MDSAAAGLIGKLIMNCTQVHSTTVMTSATACRVQISLAFRRFVTVSASWHCESQAYLTTTNRSISVTCSCMIRFELHSHISGSVVAAFCLTMEAISIHSTSLATTVKTALNTVMTTVLRKRQQSALICIFIWLICWPTHIAVRIFTMALLEGQTSVVLYEDCRTRVVQNWTL